MSGDQAGCQSLRTAQALGISGEISYRVPSLSLPDPHTLPTLENLRDYEAIKLLVARASADNPDFSLTAQNAEAVVQVCRHLDGIPLALELAAARLKVLPVGQLAARLDDRFRLLTEGSRTALPRHKTLRALVDWSYELLAPAEQKLLARLSVFAGSWTLSAAEAISRESGEGLADYEILDALTGLVNKSLAQLQENKNTSEARYAFLETIRQYGLEKLKAAGEEEEVRQRHLAYYAALMEELRFEMQSRDQVKALRQLDPELDNLRVAIDYGLRAGQVEDLVWISCSQYWDIRGYYTEQRRYLEQVLALPDTRGINRGWVLCCLGWVAGWQADVTAEYTYFEECLALSKQEEFQDKELLKALFLGLGNIYDNRWQMNSDLENLSEARRYLKQVLALAEETSDVICKAAVLHSLGMIFADQGDCVEAQRLYSEALALARGVGYQHFMISLILGSQARLAMILEDYTAAHHYLEECWRTSEEIGFYLGKIDAQSYQDMVWCREGKAEEARRALEEALALCLQTGQKNVTTNSLQGVASLLIQSWLKSGEAANLAKVATLGGAIWALVGSPNAKEPLLAQPFIRYYKETLDLARSKLAEAAFKEAFASGQAMSLEEAIAYARQALRSL
jgi:non-specific serine/threonine protein kinase